MGDGVWVIPVTEYVLPNGRKASRLVNVSDEETFWKHQELLDFGWRLEMEVLTTGEHSWTVVGRGIDGGEMDQCIEIMSHNYRPAVVVKKLVADARARIEEMGLKEYE